MADTTFYEFGAFSIDVSRRVLFKNGERKPLGAKPFDMLVLLIQHREQGITRQELERRIWPAASISDNTFNVTLSMVRRALGESARSHQYILTTPTGYRFIAQLTERPTAEQEVNSQALAPPEVNAPEQPPPTRLGNGSDEPLALSQPSVADRRTENSRRTGVVAMVIGGFLLLSVALLFMKAQRDKQLATAPDNLSVQSSAHLVGDAASALVEEGEVIRLTNHPANDACPSWSPDGKLIAFISNREKTIYWGDIWLMNADGSNLHRLTIVPDSPHGLGQHPVWLGMTGDIAVWESVNYHEILRFQLSANPKLPVIRNVEDFDSPYFKRMLVVPARRGTRSFTVTKDGRRAAWSATSTPWYACPTEGILRTSLVSRLNGGDVLSSGTQVVSGLLVCDVQPGKSPFEGIAFSPDGSQIVVARSPDPKAYGFDLEVYNLEGTLVVRLTDNGGGTSPVINWNPDWSSDNRITFASNRTGRFEVYTVNPDGSDLHQLTSKGGDFPNWSPNGKQVSFQSERDGNKEIYTIAIK